MSNKLAVPISDQPYYDDSPIGSIKDWHIGVDSRARSTKKISGTCTADTTDKLTYATGGFTASVSVGDIVYNSTDNVYAFVEAVDSNTVLSLDWDAFPDGNEDFEIYIPTTPGYGWNRLDTDLTVDDTSSPYYGLTVRAQQAKITEGYDTGWVANSDWTDAELTVTHNLNANLSDLIVKFYISTDGTEANAIEIFDNNRDAGSSFFRGFSIYQSSNNAVLVQTATDGITFVDTDGTPESWLAATSGYYKVKVYRKQDIGIIPIIKTKAGLAVLSSLAVDTLTVNGVNFDSFAVGTIVMYDGTGWVDNTTMTGWYACIADNAAQGAPNLVDTFIMGSTTSGTTGGSNTHTHSATSGNDSHNHVWAYQASSGANSLINSFDDAWSSSHARGSYNSSGSSRAFNGNNGAYGWEHLLYSQYTNNDSHNHTITVNSADGRPAYYTVIFIRKCS